MNNRFPVPTLAALALLIALLLIGDGSGVVARRALHMRLAAAVKIGFIAFSATDGAVD